MNLRSLPKEKLLQSLTYYIGFVALGLAMVSTGPSLPNLIANTHSTIDAFAIVFTIASLGFMAGSFWGGWLFDRIKGNVIIALAFFTMTVCLAIIPSISTIWLMAGVMFINALAMSLVDMGSNTLMTWVHGEAGGPFMNALHFFFGLGAAISPLLVGKLVNLSGDIYWAYWLLAALMVPAALFALFTPSPQIRHTQKEKDQAVRNSRAYLVILMVFFFLLYVAVEANFGNYIFTYIKEMGFASQSGTGYGINSIFWGMLTVGRFLAIPIAARLNPRAIITIDLIGAVISFLTIILFKNSLTAIWIGAILLGLSQASIFPTGLIFAEKHLRLTGKITSYFYLGISLSNMLFAWLIGQFFESKGPFSFIIFLSILLGFEIINWVMVLLATNKKEGEMVNTC